MAACGAVLFLLLKDKLLIDKPLPYGYRRAKSKAAKNKNFEQRTIMLVSWARF
jgi:hypothetical protein